MSPLRRTGPPARRTPLVARTPLAPGVPLQRSAPLARTSPLRTHAEFRAAYRPVVTVEERTARAVVRARSAGLCEGCGHVPATDWAHRVARAHGGPWCPSNGLALCGGLSGPTSRPGALSCHQWSHENPAEARTVGWILRSGTDPLTAPALLHGRGWTYLTADGLYVPAPTEGGAA